MALPNIFTEDVHNQTLTRLSKLNSQSKPLWGKMSIGQMLAHCCVPYEYVYDSGKYKAPSGLRKLILKWFIKAPTINDKPYKKNSPTAPDFMQTTEKEFSVEMERLTSYISKVYEEGEVHFEGLSYHSFGKLSAAEYSNMFYKHLNHHLSQFGV